jgi:hypothetical protein
MVFISSQRAIIRRVLRKYTNHSGLHINYRATVKHFSLVIFVRLRHNTKCTSDFYFERVQREDPQRRVSGCFEVGLGVVRSSGCCNAFVFISLVQRSLYVVSIYVFPQESPNYGQCGPKHAAS